MKERDLILMKSLIESYVKQGIPIGSKALLRTSHLSVSPATVRNIMADLERQGLLLSPHTSAGRIPTTQGLRIFVDRLVTVRSLRSEVVAHVKRNLNPNQETKALLGNASNLLSDMTKMASLVQIPCTPVNRLQHVDFVPLSDQRLLVVMVLENDEIQNRVIAVDRNYQRDELAQMSNFLNRHLVGKDVNSARQELFGQLLKEKQELDVLLQRAIDFAEQGFEHSTQLSADSNQPFHFSGQTNLVSMASHGQLDNIEQVFGAFKQKQQIMGLLDRSLAADGVKIFIGEESGSEGLSGCSIVSAPYKQQGKSIGVLAVVGPTRMQYDKVIPIVDVTAKMLSSALDSKSSPVSL
ncbi:MAG: heat-inducible transcriptional repressor HrcA [Kangiellaceae bacterium]|nr:heat-inducible transcriptional repressor HrcA [Kangiellaceae bacterium]